MLNRLMQTRTNSNPLGELFPDLDDSFFSFTPGELPTVETTGELISNLWSKVEDFSVWDEVHGLLPPNGQLGDVLSTIGDSVSDYLDVSAIAASAGSGSSDDTDDADAADDTDTDDDADDSDDDADASDDTVSADDTDDADDTDSADNADFADDAASAERASFEGLGAIGDALSAVGDAIGGLFHQVSPAIGDALQQVGQAISDILTPIWERLASLLPTEGPLADLISRLGDWGAAISDWWSSATDAPLQTSDSPAPDWLSGLFDPIVAHRESGDMFS